MKKLAPLALALPLSLAAAAPAYAADDTWTFQGNLEALNSSGVSGQTWVKVHDGQATVTINVSGAVEGMPHAQHIHIGGEGHCPTMEAAGEDGILSTVEGKPAYGGIKKTLTVEGDTSPKSALAVKRMPTGGSYTYERTIDVSDEVVQGLSDGMGSIVVHGIDTIKADGKYSGEPKSELNPKLPLEATAPAACAELAAAPQGGMATGNGGATDNGVNTGLLGLGGALVAAAGGGVFVTRRLRGNS